MALKAVVDTLEGIPEALHAEYVQKNGKYELQDDIGADVGAKTFTDFRIAVFVPHICPDTFGAEAAILIIADLPGSGVKQSVAEFFGVFG